MSVNQEYPGRQEYLAEFEKQNNRLKGKSIPISPEELKQEALIDLQEALRYFIERQKLVAQAMTEMGLDLDEVAAYGILTWVSEFPPDKNGKISKPVENFKKMAESESAEQRKLYQVAKRASERNLPRCGIWRDREQNEWEYSLHGIGCLLKNVKTGEPIDWDAPNVNSYTPMFFEQNLLWQISHPYRSIKLGFLRSVMLQPVKAMLKEIAGDNLSS